VLVVGAGNWRGAAQEGGHIAAETDNVVVVVIITPAGGAILASVAAALGALRLGPVGAGRTIALGAFGVAFARRGCLGLGRRGGGDNGRGFSDGTLLARL